MLSLAIASAAPPARASDGVLEISSTCATLTACFPGDSAGYPVEITTPGSYRLTSNLVASSQNVTGILISTSDVSIDLAGFSIIRFTCVGATTDCTAGSGTGAGIAVDSFLHRGITVRNGSITGMGTHGVSLGEQAEVTNVWARWNRLHGIFTSHGATITGNTVHGNGDNGITAGAASTVSGNTARGQGEDGINVGSFSTISYNTSFDNVGNGIDTGEGSNVVGNTVGGNISYGLFLGAETAYRGNAITTPNIFFVQGGVSTGGNSCGGSVC